MNRLLRELAPISEPAWRVLDAEACRVLTACLGGRRVVDFDGPHGWRHAAVSLGRAVAVEGAPGEGVRAMVRRVLPLVEVRSDFALPRSELEAIERGAEELALEPLDRAAREIARAENVAVLHGFAGAGIAGVSDASEHEPIHLGEDPASFPRHVARAVEVLRRSGVGGPYALALSPEGYTTAIETAEHGGVLLLEHLRRILDGPIVWSPGVNGAVVLSRRGGDFRFVSGADLALGYRSHDAESVHLYLDESFTFQVLAPEAGVALAA